MAIDPKTTALLLLEYENNLTTEGGAATLAEEGQRFTLGSDLPMFARILSHQEFIAEAGAS